MIVILYIFILLIATTLGATAGLGGGIIIKPLLDLIGYHDIVTISFVSTSAVFTMSLYAVSKQIHNGIKIDWNIIVLIVIGAMIGGVIGNELFSYCLHIFDQTLLKIIQATLLMILLVLVLLYSKTKVGVKVDTMVVYILVGLSLGIVSSFLGIGGGPINVAIFICFFWFDLKVATIYSLATILFSQGSKLVTIALTSGFDQYDISILVYVIPVAILGGVLGSYLHKRLSEERITKIFKISIIGIIFINILIVFKNII